MRYETTKALLLATLLLALSATVALARKDAGTGTLEDVDLEARTVTIDSRIYGVVSTSELLDSQGSRLSLGDLERTNGAWVTYAAGFGAQRPVIQRLVVEDVNSDESGE